MYMYIYIYIYIYIYVCVYVCMYVCDLTQQARTFLAPLVRSVSDDSFICLQPAAAYDCMLRVGWNFVAWTTTPTRLYYFKPGMV